MLQTITRFDRARYKTCLAGTKSGNNTVNEFIIPLLVHAWNWYCHVLFYCIKSTASKGANSVIERHAVK